MTAELAPVVRIDPAARRPVPPLTVAQAYRRAVVRARATQPASTPAARLADQLAAAAVVERAALAALTA